MVLVERGRGLQQFVGVAVDCELLELSTIHAETTQLSDHLPTTLPAHRSEWSRVARVSNLAVLPKVVEHGRGVQPFVGIVADCDDAELGGTHADIVEL